MNSGPKAGQLEACIYGYSKMIASTGGTTEAALMVFKECRISELISAASTRARERSRELSKQ
ncbi:MAG: hypothetical protein JSW59_12290 [Phycisphaerales bacterium]|nr:MAG: hypothetical protein JSW59_12290 [Phycisphaerales bacterium]